MVWQAATKLKLHFYVQYASNGSIVLHEFLRRGGWTLFDNLCTVPRSPLPPLHVINIQFVYTQTSFQVALSKVEALCVRNYSKTSKVGATISN